MKSSTKPATTFMEGTYFDEGKEYPFSLNSAEIYYIFNAICSYDLNDDNEKGVDHFPKLYDVFYANHLNKLGEEIVYEKEDN
jgi:hypothetical protein